MKLVVLMGALAIAPLFSQTALDPVVKKNKVEWWHLTETPAVVSKTLGQPSQVSEAGEGYVSWQHRLPGIDHESDVSSQMIFSRATGQLVSVTRSYESEIDVTRLFPARESTVQPFPDNPNFRFLVRRLPNDRILVACGLASGTPYRTTQLLLMRPDELKRLYPWVQIPPPI